MSASAALSAACAWLSGLYSTAVKCRPSLLLAYGAVYIIAERHSCPQAAPLAPSRVYPVSENNFDLYISPLASKIPEKRAADARIDKCLCRITPPTEVVCFVHYQPLKRHLDPDA